MRPSAGDLRLATATGLISFQSFDPDSLMTSNAPFQQHPSPEPPRNLVPPSAEGFKSVPSLGDTTELDKRIKGGRITIAVLAVLSVVAGLLLTADGGLMAQADSITEGKADSEMIDGPDGQPITVGEFKAQMTELRGVIEIMMMLSWVVAIAMISLYFWAKQQEAPFAPLLVASVITGFLVLSEIYFLVADVGGTGSGAFGLLIRGVILYFLIRGTLAAKEKERLIKQAQSGPSTGAAGAW